MPRLHINFTGPQHGWLGIRIQAHGEEINIDAFCTPHDTFEEFVEALVQILECSSSKPIPINEEPQESELQFIRDGDTLVITHTMKGNSGDGSQTTIRAPFRSATREMARKLKLLYEKVGYDGFVEHWRGKPPKQQIARAWKHFARPDGSSDSVPEDPGSEAH